MRKIQQKFFLNKFQTDWDVRNCLTKRAQQEKDGRYNQVGGVYM